MSSLDGVQLQSRSRTARASVTVSTSTTTSTNTDSDTDDENNLATEQAGSADGDNNTSGSSSSSSQRSQTIVAMETGSSLAENVIHVISPAVVATAATPVGSASSSAVTVTPNVHTITISGNNLSIPFSSSLVS